MTDNALSLQNKVEYIVVKNQRSKRTRLLLALVVAALTAIAIVAFFSEKNPKRDYPDYPLPALGLTGSLKTKWLEGKLHYRFAVAPAPNQLDRFHAVLQHHQAKDLKFYIHLRDTDGFDICSANAPMHQHLGHDGSPDSLEADQAFSNCTEDQFKSAPQWSISGTYPTISESLDIDTTNGNNQSASIARLTGRDFFSGEIETLERGSFQITKKAEYMTLMGWQPNDNISVDCAKSLCVLTNLRTQESVHTTAK